MKTSLSKAACILSRIAVNKVCVVFEDIRNDGYSRPKRAISPTSFNVCVVDNGSQHVSTCSAVDKRNIIIIIKLSITFI